MSVILKTEFGNAKINSHGYYHITSKKEGNCLKLLHRLIWEKFYGSSVPNGYVIHHKNGNKLDNCILNLQLIRQKNHSKQHSIGKNNYWYGKTHSIDTLKKMSKSKNNTGYFRVRKQKCENCKQGFIWVYRYSKNGKAHVIKSVSLDTLKTKVESNGLKWIEL